MSNKFYGNPVVLLFIFYSITRLIFAGFLNVQFEYSWVFQMWHFIDIELLKNKLYESVLYFHYQPPLFNLFLGLIHKQDVINAKSILMLFYYLITFIMGVIIYKFSLEMIKSKLLAFIFAVIFYLMPETIIYENWPIYTWTSSFLIIISFYFLRRFNVHKSEKYLHFFFLSQVILVLTRSAFHPVFFICFFLFLLVILKNERTKVIKAFSPSALILLTVCMKNLFIFGFFGVGSGLGFSLYKITPKTVDERNVVDESVYPEIFNIVPVKSIETYNYTQKGIPEKFKGIEILNDNFKSTLGQYSEEFSVNLGNYHYLDIAKKYQKSAIALIKKYPKEYFKRVFRGVIMYFKPTWDHGFGAEHNAKVLFPYINILTFNNLRLRAENAFVQGEKPWPLKNQIPYSSYIFIPVIYLILLILLFYNKLIFNKKSIEYLFLIFVTLYLFTVSNLIELAENDRYRVMVDPLVYMVFINLGWSFFRRKNTSGNHESSV